VYGWIYRHLPADPLRMLLACLLVAAAVALLLFVALPAVEPLVPLGNVTVRSDRKPMAASGGCYPGGRRRRCANAVRRTPGCRRRRPGRGMSVFG
jgi:hypothetical protein